MRFLICLISVMLLSGQNKPLTTSVPDAQRTYNAGDVRGAERQLLDILANAKKMGYGPFEVALVHSNLGVMYQDVGRARDAERCYLKASALLDADMTGDARTLWVRTVTNLASLYTENGQIGKAQRLLDRITKAESLSADDAARIQGTVASVDMVRGRKREAEEKFLTLFAYWERTGNPRAAAIIMNNLGVLAIERKDYQTAVERTRRAVELWQQALGPDHPAAVIATANYGSALLVSGRRAEAVDLLRRALEVVRQYPGDATPVMAQMSRLYAAALDANGERKLAKQVRAEAERLGAALSATDPARHTVDVLDFNAPQRRLR